MAAQSFWDVVWEGIRWHGQRVGQGYSDPGFPENYRLGLESLLANTFDRIANSYSDIDAQTLYDWAQRQFIDHQQINLWSTWSALFAGAAFETVPLDLPDEQRAPIKQLIEDHFGASVRSRETELLELAESIPLSTSEKRMLALEVTRPDDFEKVDLIQTLERIIQHQHAYQVWIELNNSIDESEREAIFWWAYREAVNIGIGASDVILPT
jgi:hypothetical protein